MAVKLMAPALAGVLVLSACATPIYLRQDATQASIERDLKACEAGLFKKKKPADAPGKTDPKKTDPPQIEPGRDTSALPVTPHHKAKDQTAVAALVVIFATSFARAAATTAIQMQQARAAAMRSCMGDKGYVSHPLRGAEASRWGELQTVAERDAFRAKLWKKYYDGEVSRDDKTGALGGKSQRDPLKRGGRDK